MAIWLTHKDKSTRHQVFKSRFIWACIFNFLSLPTTIRYSDHEKERLKWKGYLWGCLFIPSLITIVGVYFLIKHVREMYNKITEPYDSKQTQTLIDYTRFLDYISKIDKITPSNTKDKIRDVNELDNANIYAITPSLHNDAMLNNIFICYMPIHKSVEISETAKAAKQLLKALSTDVRIIISDELEHKAADFLKSDYIFYISNNIELKENAIISEEAFVNSKNEVIQKVALDEKNAKNYAAFLNAQVSDGQPPIIALDLEQKIVYINNLINGSTIAANGLSVFALQIKDTIEIIYPEIQFVITDGFGRTALKEDSNISKEAFKYDNTTVFELRQFKIESGKILYI